MCSLSVQAKSSTDRTAAAIHKNLNQQWNQYQKHIFLTCIKLANPQQAERAAACVFWLLSVDSVRHHFSSTSIYSLEWQEQVTLTERTLTFIQLSSRVMVTDNRRHRYGYCIIYRVCLTGTHTHTLNSQSDVQNQRGASVFIFSLQFFQCIMNRIVFNAGTTQQRERGDWFFPSLPSSMWLVVGNGNTRRLISCAKL